MVAWGEDEEEAVKLKGLVGLWVLSGIKWERGNEEVERERVEK